MVNIVLIGCNFNCFGHKTFDFFGNHESNKFLVSFRFKGNKTTNYGLLESHINGAGHTMLVLNGQILYEYSDRCIITGYYPIEINMGKAELVCTEYIVAFNLDDEKNTKYVQLKETFEHGELFNKITKTKFLDKATRFQNKDSIQKMNIKKPYTILKMVTTISEETYIGQDMAAV